MQSTRRKSPEKKQNFDSNAVESATEKPFFAIGEDPERGGLKRTPYRAANMYEELFSSYNPDPEKAVTAHVFNVEYDEMVVVRDIEFYSLCVHHMLPFMGRSHIAYIPNGKVIGLSKIPHIVEIFARRLQL